MSDDLVCGCHEGHESAAECPEAIPAWLRRERDEQPAWLRECEEQAAIALREANRLDAGLFGMMMFGNDDTES